MKRYFDDFAPGDGFTSAPASLSEAEIVEFARRWDPQPFHIDREAAKHSIFGELIASGFQVIAFGFKLIHEAGMKHVHNLGGHGVDEIRWKTPLRPGEAVTVTATVEKLIPSKSKPDRGTARVRYVMRGAAGREILSMVLMQIVKRRPVGGRR